MDVKVMEFFRYEKKFLKASVEVYSKCPDYLLPGKIASMEARINLITKVEEVESVTEDLGASLPLNPGMGISSVFNVNLADNLDVARMYGARRNQVQTVGRPSENAFKVFDEKPNPNSWNKQCEMPRSLISRIGPLAVSEELGCEALNHEYGVREKQVEEKPKIKGSEVDLSVRDGFWRQMGIWDDVFACVQVDVLYFWAFRHFKYPDVLNFLQVDCP
ncbi:hypothetical protein U1Q18_041893 [Sarracenia purpurea var. burkii]